MNHSSVKTSKGNIKRKTSCLPWIPMGIRKGLCFSPEKHLLINKVVGTDKACELKGYQ